MKKDKNISILISEIKKILINENKIEDIIKTRINLPSDIADWIMDEYPDKFQLWIADNFKKEAIKRIAGGKEVVENVMIKMLKGDKTQPSLQKQLLRQKDYFKGMIQHILGWLQGRREIAPESDELNLKTMSFAEAVRRADVWQEEVRRLQTGRITDESGKIIKTYPDGFYWLDLQTSSCSQEAKAMGHCGRAIANGILYSLRSNKNPSITAEINRGALIQLRGRANTKPKEEYHDKIMDFLLNDEVGVVSINSSTYRPNDNFELNDLNLDQITTLYQAKPRLFAPEELYKVLMKFPEFATQVNFKVTPLFDDHKEHLSRINPAMKELFNR